MTKSVFSAEYERFCRLLVEARRSANLTQIQLAVALSRPQSYVSKYERGERRLDVIEFLEIARALKLDAVSFLEELQQGIEGSKDAD